MKQLFSIDMEAEGQNSKLITDIPSPDVVIIMGCNVSCPYIPFTMREDWGLDDPTGKSDDVFITAIRTTEEKVLSLKSRLM